MTKFVMTKKLNMLGEKLKQLRIQQKLKINQVSRLVVTKQGKENQLKSI